MKKYFVALLVWTLLVALLLPATEGKVTSCKKGAAEVAQPAACTEPADESCKITIGTDGKKTFDGCDATAKAECPEQDTSNPAEVIWYCTAPDCDACSSTGPGGDTPPGPPSDLKSKVGFSVSNRIGRSELVVAFLLGLITFYIVRFILRYADPIHQQKAKAEVNAKEIMDRLGVENLTLNEHEVMIASHLVDPSHLKISWADIGGLDGVIEKIKKTVIYPVLAQQRIVGVSRLIQPPMGVLLYGPPGCGKTLIAKAMAKESGCWFIEPDVSVLTDKWYGESQKLTAAVFSLAKKLQPCIIFIDEIDSLLGHRATQDHEVPAMLKAQLMSLWDGFITDSDSDKTVIVMGATNRPEDMDTAILRRMETKFHIPIPDLNQRKHILDLALKDEVLDADFNLDKLADMTEGFSGSDLEEVVRSAAVACLADLGLSAFGGRTSNSRSLASIGSGAGDAEETLSMHAEPPRRSSWFNVFSRKSVDLSSRSNDSQLDHNPMEIRPIRMRDFELAVLKAKEAKAYCSRNNLNELVNQ